MEEVDLRHCRAFLAVAETLNFRAAARALYVTQPALSRTVRDLEAALGTLLLERSTRRVALTEAGRVFRPEAAALLRQAERARAVVRRAVEGPRGRLAVGYGVAAMPGPMSRMIVDFKAAYPGIAVSLLPMSTEEQLEALAAGRIDVGFAILAGVPAGIPRLVVSREPLVLICRQEHWAAAAEAVAPAALAHEPFVLGNRRWGAFRAAAEAACLSGGFLPQPVAEADDLLELHAMVATGMGVTFLNRSARRSLPPEVAAVPLAGSHPLLTVGLIWHADAAATAVAAFVEAVRQSTLRSGT